MRKLLQKQLFGRWMGFAGWKSAFSISISATKVQLNSFALPAEDLPSKKQLRIYAPRVFGMILILDQTKGLG